MAEDARMRAGDRDRDVVLDVLRDAHGAGRLELSELDQRTDRVMAARFLDELAPIVADLPEGRALDLAHPTSSGTVVPARAAAAQRPTTDQPETRSFAVMSGRDIVPQLGTNRIKGFAWWGGDDIDLSHCLGPGVTVELDMVAVMAGCTIQVPPGVHVVDQTLNIMAGNSIEQNARGDGSQGTVILKGFSWWAGHTVKLAQTLPALPPGQA